MQTKEKINNSSLPSIPLFFIPPFYGFVCSHNAKTVIYIIALLCFVWRSKLVALLLSATKLRKMVSPRRCSTSPSVPAALPLGRIHFFVWISCPRVYKHICVCAGECVTCGRAAMGKSALWFTTLWPHWLTTCSLPTSGTHSGRRKKSDIWWNTSHDDDVAPYQNRIIGEPLFSSSFSYFGLMRRGAAHRMPSCSLMVPRRHFIPHLRTRTRGAFLHPLWRKGCAKIRRLFTRPIFRPLLLLSGRYGINFECLQREQRVCEREIKSQNARCFLKSVLYTPAYHLQT